MKAITFVLLLLASTISLLAQDGMIPTASSNRFAKWGEAMLSPVVRDTSSSINKRATFFNLAAQGLNWSDYVITKHALSRGAIEANPFMAPMFEHEPAAFGVKCIAIPITMNLSIKALHSFSPRSKSARVTKYVLWGISIGTLSYVNVHNIRVTRKLNSPHPY